MLSIAGIVSEMFGLDTIKATDDRVIQKVILAPTNVNVLELNDQILAKV